MVLLLPLIAHIIFACLPIQQTNVVLLHQPGTLSALVIISNLYVDIEPMSFSLPSHATEVQSRPNKVRTESELKGFLGM
ncbi:conserved hypothetical protein [Ricinus communis]|uniref:Uncharacterized protein n=1 Tax=Ricinus communis TaxID=3988 RepID=B9SM22_RICCO|nr:conserved hypothetical protein [Ricinus communis]